MTSQEPTLPPARSWTTKELAALPPLPDVRAAMADTRAERLERSPRRLLHTGAPRWLCTLGFASLAAVPLIDLARTAADRAADPSAAPFRFELGTPHLAALIAYWIGWLWWSVAASVNQRRVFTIGSSPLTTPVALVASYGILTLPGRMGTGYDDMSAVMFATVGLLFVNLVALMSYRSTAARIGADRAAWNRLMTVPFASGGVAAACFLTSAALGTAFIVAGVCTLALGVTVTITSMHRATRSWDDAVALRRAALLR